MKKNCALRIAGLLLLAIICGRVSFAQNSILVNFGANSCAGTGEPSFSFIKDPLGNEPMPLINCSLASQVPDIFGVFIAYNPKDNKLYVADIRTFTETKIWVIDAGLPVNISCPALLNTTPDYTYSYVSNNFEFDNNGNLWSFSNYNDTTGQCNIDQFDIHSGTIMNTHTVQFPAGNFPTSITSGDLAILPNGRMFATLGSFPSKLYEITNYNNAASNATADYLTTLPQSCFGIAYLNGLLEITGTDFSGNCYYYQYDIAANELNASGSFQNGQLPIDNTSITPSIGVTKQLLNASKVNENTVDLIYQIYVKNLGNVALNNINVCDNLAAIYGAGNISNIHVTFVPGGNAAGLAINPAYNGSSDTALLIAGQNLPNQTSVNTDYFFKLQLSFRVTQINPVKTYLNSAVGIATIGNVGTSTIINVSDSSNNGPEEAVDPNNNGNAGEPGENLPTPFNLTTLPLKFISIHASLLNKTTAMVNWVVATPSTQSDKFVVESCTDAINWNNLGIMNLLDNNQKNYQFVATNLPPGNVYFRVKEIDSDGTFVYSNIILLRNKDHASDLSVFPNPANNHIIVSLPETKTGSTTLSLYDATGRKLAAETMTGTTKELDISGFPAGTYLLKIVSDGSATTRKIVVNRR